MPQYKNKQSVCRALTVNGSYMYIDFDVENFGPTSGCYGIITIHQLAV